MILNEFGNLDKIKTTKLRTVTLFYLLWDVQGRWVGVWVGNMHCLLPLFLNSKLRDAQSDMVSFCYCFCFCLCLWSLRGSHLSVCIFLCVCCHVFFVWLPVVNLAALLFIFSIWLILSRGCGSQTVQPYRRIGLTYVL